MNLSDLYTKLIDILKTVEPYTGLYGDEILSKEIYCLLCIFIFVKISDTVIITNLSF